VHWCFHPLPLLPHHLATSPSSHLAISSSLATLLPPCDLSCRLSKLDHLEDRLSALTQRLEAQLQQPAVTGESGGAGGEGQGMPVWHAHPAQTVRIQAPGAGQLLDGSPAQQQQQQEPSAAELHLMMGQLQRMEEQENAMRYVCACVFFVSCRWSVLIWRACAAVHPDLPYHAVVCCDVLVVCAVPI